MLLMETLVAVGTTDPVVARLLELAKLHGLGQDADLARALGVSRGSISRMRSGTRGAGLEMRRRIERLFPQYERRYLFPDEALELTA